MPTPALLFLALLSLIGCALFIGCAAGLSSAQVECQLGVLRALPEDPMLATAADAVVAIHRLKACNALPPDALSPDATSPPATVTTVTVTVTPATVTSTTTGAGPPLDAGRSSAH